MKDEQISLKVIGAIIATGILSFCGVLAETAMNVAFPTFIEEFGINTATVQWLTTIYLLVLSIVVPVSGYLKHSVSNKKLFLGSMLIFLVGVVVAAISPNFVSLLLGRAVQGLATGIALPLMFNIIMEQVPPSKIGMMMGVGTMIPAIAPALGPIFGGVVITQFGWRYVFWLLLPILILALCLGMGTIEQQTTLQKQPFDSIGLLQVAIIFTGLIFGFSSMGAFSLLSVQVLMPLALAIIGSICFIRHIQHREEAILKISLLTDKRFAVHVFSYFIIQLVLMGLVFVLPNYLQLVNGLDAQSSGLVVFPGAALGAALTPFGGRLLDKYGAKKPILWGSTLILISLMLFFCLSDGLLPFVIGSLYFAFTLGIGFSFGNVMTNGIYQLEKSRQADGNAIMMTFQQVAGAMGTSLVASILSMAQEGHESGLVSGTVVGSRLAFGFLILLSLAECWAMLRIFVKKEK